MKRNITEVLDGYDIGKLISYSLLKHGFANENYRIETDKGVYLYRICKQQSTKEVQNEINFLQILKNAEFPAAYPIPRIDDTFICKSNIFPIVIYDYIEGEIPKPSEKTVAEIGKTVAKLNLLEGHELFQNKHIINIQQATKLKKKFAKAKYQYPDIYKDFSKAIFHLKDKLGENLPKGFIHGDVFPDNTIFNVHKLMAIIDFEMFCVDNLLFDVGMTINGFCFVNNRLDHKLLNYFLSAYQSIRPLNKAEKEHLPYYIMWTAVGMASWHLQNDMLNTKNDKQTARVRELLDRYKATVLKF